MNGLAFEYLKEKRGMGIIYFNHSWAELRPQDGEQTRRELGGSARIRQQTQSHVICRTPKSGGPTPTKRHWRWCGICILWRTIVRPVSNTMTESVNVSRTCSVKTIQNSYLIVGKKSARSVWGLLSGFPTILLGWIISLTKFIRMGKFPRNWIIYQFRW